MKFNRKEHSHFVQWLDRTAEENPLLWLPCVVLLVIALGAENICGIVSTAFPRREKICVSDGKADVQLVRKPFAFRVVAMSLAMAFMSMTVPEFVDVFSIDVFAEDNNEFTLGESYSDAEPYNTFSSNMSDYNVLYNEKLMEELNGEHYSTKEYFDLYDLDFDGIPELFISDGYYIKGIYTVCNNTLIDMGGGASYGERSLGAAALFKDGNCIYFQNYNLIQGHEFTSYSKKSGNSLIAAFYASNDAGYSSENPGYMINGISVSKKEYDESIAKFEETLIYEKHIGKRYTLDVDSIISVFPCGKCGDNAYWELSPEGIFTVTGTGAIYDYDFNLDDLNANEPWQNSKVKKAVINDGITRIGNDFLMFCTNIETIILPQSLVEIGSGAFCYTNIKEINLPNSIIKMENYVFEGCQKLEEVTLPSNLTELSDGLFNYCGVKKVILPNGLKKIGGSFSHCAIEYLNIPDSVTHIESGAFFRCYIKEITIPNGVSSIESGTFEDCWELEKIIIPSTVININNNAFIGYQNLTIYGYLGSTAETYANENNIPFISLDNSELLSFRKNPLTIAYLCEQKEQLFYSGNDDIVDVKWEIGDESILRINNTEIQNHFGFDDIEDGRSDIDNPFGKHSTVYFTVEGLKPGNTTLKATVNDKHTTIINVEVDDVDLTVSADRTNLCLYLNSAGDELTVNAALKSNNHVIYVDDTYEFYLAYDTSALEIHGSYIKGEGATYKIKPLKKGKFDVTITDNKFGLVKIIPITVLDTLSGFSYTINNVPVTDQEMQTNFIISGMYVDKFASEVSNTNKSCHISFDVYNHTYAYGIVDVYDKDGNYIKSTLLSPYSGLPTSIKEATWDNLSGLFTEWFIEDTLLTYRQETGMCKKTHVDIPDVPLGGYITITNNPDYSVPLMIVDGVDIIFTFKNSTDGFKDNTANQINLKGSLEERLPVIMTEISRKVAENGSDKYILGLAKRMGKAFIKKSDGFAVNGNILNEFAEWLRNYDVDNAIGEILFSSGFSIAEHIITKFGGTYGTILSGAFTTYEYINLTGKINSWMNVSGTGNKAIYIHVPEGGTANCKNISVSGNFDIYTSLNVYELSIDDEILNHLPDSITQATVDEITEATKLVYPYNITLYRNGDEIQPSEKITVSIRIPTAIINKLSTETTQFVKLIRVEPDGTSTEMPITITEDNHIIFETNHLSTYILYYDYINSNKHTHSFSTDWKYDSTSHWHECSCGERSDTAVHTENSGVVTVQPTTTSTGTRIYSCTVCGYVTRTETIPMITPPTIPSHPDPIIPSQPYPAPGTELLPPVLTENKNIDVSVTSDLKDLAKGEARIKTKRRFFDVSAEIRLTNTEKSEAAGKRALERLDDNSLICYPFDISVYNADSGSKMQLAAGGYITFEIAVPKSMEANAMSIEVYHIPGGVPGHIESEIITDKYDNLKIVFTANEFSPYMFTAVAGEDIASGAGVTAGSVSVDMTSPVTNGVSIPTAKLPRVLRYSGKKRRYRILRKRRLDDLVFVY